MNTETNLQTAKEFFAAMGSGNFASGTPRHGPGRDGYPRLWLQGGEAGALLIDGLRYRGNAEHRDSINQARPIKVG